MANAYTPAWFDVVLRRYWPETTAREVDFLARQLPIDMHYDVLDVCYGAGRHALPLAARGYRVTGLDRDETALSKAPPSAVPLGMVAGGSATFVQGDMRDLAAKAPGAFDAVICMWQRFGYFDVETNANILRQMRDALRPGGRLILDLYNRDNRDAFAPGSATDTTERAGRRITTLRTLTGDRLAVSIDYGADLPRDTFEWQLYRSDEIGMLAEAYGLRTRLACAAFDEGTVPTASEPRIQMVFERVV